MDDALGEDKGTSVSSDVIPEDLSGHQLTFFSAQLSDTRQLFFSLCLKTANSASFSTFSCLMMRISSVISSHILYSLAISAFSRRFSLKFSCLDCEIDNSSWEQFHTATVKSKPVSEKKPL